MKFQIGDRVRISENCFWAKGATGHIAEHPFHDFGQDKEPYDGCGRIVQGINGSIEYYWVEFDEPQDDYWGGSPALSAEIEADMIEPV